MRCAACNEMVFDKYQSLRVGPLHDLVTWYGINYAGTQVSNNNNNNNSNSNSNYSNNNNNYNNLIIIIIIIFIQLIQWDFQNKEKSGWAGAGSFVL